MQWGVPESPSVTESPAYVTVHSFTRPLPAFHLLAATPEDLGDSLVLGPRERTVSWVGASMLSLQSCLTLCDPMDPSPPGFSVQETLQARILEWAAVPSSRGCSRSRDRTRVSYVSCIGRRVLHH